MPIKHSPPCTSAASSRTLHNAHTYTHAHSVPGTPVLLSVLPTVRDRSPALDISWSQPHSDIALLDFVIEYWEHKPHVHSVVTNLSSVTLSHLALGVAYSVRVAARSALGQGRFSAVQERSTLNGEEVYVFP